MCFSAFNLREAWGHQRDLSLQPNGKWKMILKIPSVRTVAKIRKRKDRQTVEIALAVLTAQGKTKNLDLPGAGQGPATDVTDAGVILRTRKILHLLRMVCIV